jgi:hypothetical protein
MIRNALTTLTLTRLGFLCVTRRITNDVILAFLIRPRSHISIRRFEAAMIRCSSRDEIDKFAVGTRRSLHDRAGAGIFWRRPVDRGRTEGEAVASIYRQNPERSSPGAKACLI